MNALKRNTILCFLALLCCFSHFSLAQVDPQWLKSWSLAVKSRPTNLTDVGHIAKPDEPGRRFWINGQIMNPDGHTPAADVLVFAYHRDHAGFDFGVNDSATETWRLQGWVKTNQDGRFQFSTIRPAADHLGREAAHIHFTVVSEQWGKQWAPKAFLNESSESLDVMIKLKSTADF